MIITVVHSSTEMRAFCVVLLFVAFAAVSAEIKVELPWKDFDQLSGTREEIYKKAIQKANLVYLNNHNDHKEIIEHIAAIKSELVEDSEAKDLEEKYLSHIDTLRFVVVPGLVISKAYAQVAEWAEVLRESQESYQTLGQITPLLHAFLVDFEAHLGSNHAFKEGNGMHAHSLLHGNHHSQIANDMKHFHEMVQKWVKKHTSATAATPVVYVTYAEMLQDMLNLLNVFGDHIATAVLAGLNTLEEVVENNAEDPSKETIKIAAAEYKVGGKIHYTHTNKAKKPMKYTTTYKEDLNKIMHSWYPTQA